MNKDRNFIIIHGQDRLDGADETILINMDMVETLVPIDGGTEIHMAGATRGIITISESYIDFIERMRRVRGII